MANPLHRMVSSSQVSSWFGQGDGNLIIPSRNSSLVIADILVIAGGGGSGGVVAGGPGWHSGGGGAGEYVLKTNYSLSKTFTVTIGSGGSGGSSNANGSNGSDSSCFNLIAVGGGGGGRGGDGQSPNNGVAGGSGGVRDHMTQPQELAAHLRLRKVLEMLVEIMLLDKVEMVVVVVAQEVLAETAQEETACHPLLLELP
jgi:hypothetical protein